MHSLFAVDKPSDLTPFFFDGLNIRALTIGDEPWFVAADVCGALGLDDASKACSRLDDDERGTNSIRTLSGDQLMLVINESGLYSLILTSRKPEAKRFKKWVTSEVLPSIRKTGSYSVQAPAVPQSLSAALRLAADQAEQIEAQQAQLALAAPKVAFVERYVEATGLKGFREVCKLLKANEARFREFVTEKKILYKLGGAWTAYQPHLDAGRFEVRTGVAESEHAFCSTKFTAKGVDQIAGEWAKHQLRAEVAA